MAKIKKELKIFLSHFFYSVFKNKRTSLAFRLKYYIFGNKKRSYKTSIIFVTLRVHKQFN